MKSPLLSNLKSQISNSEIDYVWRANDPGSPGSSVLAKPRAFPTLHSLHPPKRCDSLERVEPRRLSFPDCTFVVRPAGDGDLTAFFRWLTHTHAMRWRVAHRSVGYGHLYGGRFKSFPVQPGESFLKVCRYVERNPLTARAVESLDDYRWSSLWVRRHGTPDQKSLLSPWPAPRPANWLKRVNEPLTPRERTAWRTTLERSRPFGDDTWTLKTVVRLDLEHTIRAEGRPKQEKRSNETTAGTIN